MKTYFPTNIINKVMACLDLKSEKHGELNCGIVECEEGCRVYIYKEEVLQGTLGFDSFREALQKVKELEKAIQGTMHFGSGNWENPSRTALQN